MKKALGRGRTHGAALVEYGLLVGLIAVVAIGSVSQLGLKVEETFGQTAHALSGAVSTTDGTASTTQGAGSDGETDTGSGTTPAPEPDPWDGVSNWEIVAGSVNYSGATILGYSPGGAFTVGSLTEASGTPPILSFYTSSYDYTYVNLQGHVLDQINTGMSVRCDDGTELLLSSAAQIREYTNPDRTMIQWRPVLIDFTPGQSYQCGLVDPNA